MSILGIVTKAEQSHLQDSVGWVEQNVSVSGHQELQQFAGIGFLALGIVDGIVEARDFGGYPRF